MSNRAKEKLRDAATNNRFTVYPSNLQSRRMLSGQVHQSPKLMPVAMSLPLQTIAIALTAVITMVVAFWPGVSIADQLEGKQTNVVILVCVIDDHSPYRIHVRSLSMNTTRAQMPIISTKSSCAQALHEFLTDGFEIVDSNLEHYFKFVLTRVDKCRKTN